MDLITEASLEALIHKATDPRNKGLDNASADAFCSIVKSKPDYSFIASKHIVAKIQSEDEWEALQGLSVLENCMKKCGPTFHSEVGKFRFLNELIKLVSPKYMGDTTSPKVRDIAVRLIYSWTVVYTKEPKIKEAYEMLKKQGVVSDDPPVATPKPSQAPKNNIPVDHEFESKLKKLLSSKNPEDLEAANRMIKSRVLETERRTTDLERVRNNVRLLSEMLVNCRPGAISTEDANLMAEVYSECEKLRPVIFRLAGETQDGDLLADILNLSEELNQVFERYKIVLSGTFAKVPSTGMPSSSLLDLSSPVRHAADVATGVSRDLLGDSPTGPIASPASDQVSEKSTLNSLDLLSKTSQPVVKTDLDQLGAIFGTLSTVSPSSVGSTIPARRTTPPPVEKSKKQKAFEELDILGESLLNQCKSDIQSRETSVEPENPTNESLHPDLLNHSQPDEVMLGMDDPPANENASADLSTNKSSEQPSVTNPEPALVVRPLTDVSVTLEKITPSSVPPMKILDSANGVSIVVHLARDVPREDVSVYVVTTTSTSPQPINDYLFQVVVPKKCKFKLQPPSGTCLPAHNPFLPLSAITQILLIANPCNLRIQLTFMLSFTLDEETVTEVGEVPELPVLKP